ncbi:hypothetical protein [Vibrio cidicii]|uniref:hypothetical protein n=1 Tax=Vibrio cidicii TaxID=1763883 RepID=UPI0018C2D5F4|nr:hypothetical protein [Vibrio cidicii]
MSTRALSDEYVPRGIVTNNGTFVFYDKRVGKLLEFDAQLTVLREQAFQSCIGEVGYFRCKETDGAEYILIDPNTGGKFDTIDDVPKLTHKLNVTYEHPNTTITDQDGTVLFDAPAGNRADLTFSLADNMLAFERSNSTDVLVVDMQGNEIKFIENDIKAQIAFHPAGYVMISSMLLRSVNVVEMPELKMTNFRTVDYLGTRNPDIINYYNISINDSNGGNDAQDTSRDSSTGGSISIWSIQIAAALMFRRKYAIH